MVTPYLIITFSLQLLQGQLLLFSYSILLVSGRTQSKPHSNSRILNDTLECHSAKQ